MSPAPTATDGACRRGDSPSDSGQSDLSPNRLQSSRCHRLSQFVCPAVAGCQTRTGPFPDLRPGEVRQLLSRPVAAISRARNKGKWPDARPAARPVAASRAVLPARASTKKSPSLLIQPQTAVPSAARPRAASPAAADRHRNLWTRCVFAPARRFPSQACTVYMYGGAAVQYLHSAPRETATAAAVVSWIAD